MKSKYFNGIDVLYNDKQYIVPIFDVVKNSDKTTALEMPEITSKEIAFNFIRDLPELTQALLYKALYMNDMRIDKAEHIIFKNRKE